MGDIINFVPRKNENQEVKKNLNGEVIDLNLRRKVVVRDRLIDDLSEPMGYMMDGLYDIHKAVYHNVDDDMLNYMENAMNEINKLYDYFHKPINMNIDELIFKLKIMLEESHYFCSVFEHLFDDDYIEYYQLKFYISLINLYVGYIKMVLYNKGYDYIEFGSVFNKEEVFVIEAVSRLKDKIKKESYMAMLHNLVNEKLSDCLSEIQMYAVDEAIKIVLDDFLEYDAVTVGKCFAKVVELFIDKGILNEKTKEGVNMKIKNVGDDIKTCKNYYKTCDIVNQFLVLASSYIHDNISNESVVGELDGLLRGLDDISHDKKQKYKFKNVEFVMKNMLKKIYFLATGTLEDVHEENVDSNLHNVINDRIILDTILTICKDLHQYVVFNNKSYLETDNFDYIWNMAGSSSLQKQLNRLVSKDMFIGEDIDIYYDSYYRELLTRVISDLSCDKYLYDFDSINTKMVNEDFDVILTMLKKSLKIEKSMNLYDMSEMIADMRNLDYTDTSKTKVFLNMIDSVFARMQYNFDLHEFLQRASYNPMKVKTKDDNYISLYDDKNNSLVLDKSNYRIINSKDIVDTSGLAIVDYNYGNKDITYSMVLVDILNKYNLAKETVFGKKKTKKL